MNSCSFLFRIIGRARIAIIVGGLAVAALIIMAIRAGGPMPDVLGPEDPSVIARRSSPDNAFYLLRDASAEINMVKSHYADVDLDGMVGVARERGARDIRGARAFFLRFDPGSRWQEAVREAMSRRTGQLKGHSLDVGHDAAKVASGQAKEPEEDVHDPMFVAYLEAAEPALETMRRGLRQPYYLLPSLHDGTVAFQENESYLSGVRILSKTLAAHAVTCWFNRRSEPALALGVELVDLGVTVASDGRLKCRDVGVAIQPAGCYIINQTIEQCGDPDALAKVLDDLRRIDEKDAPWSRTVDAQFRYALRFTIDDLPPESALRGFAEIENRAVGERECRQAIQEYIQEYMSRFPPEDDRPYWLSGKKLPRRPSLTVSYEAVGDLEMSRLRQAMSRTFRHATMANVALSIWYLRNGSYPDSLAELVPEFLLEIPLDRTSLKPLTYCLLDSSYALYSNTGTFHTPRNGGIQQGLLSGPSDRRDDGLPAAVIATDRLGSPPDRFPFLCEAAQ